jgi:pimeloyl-ACP methyl ester carboxylesterase
MFPSRARLLRSKWLVPGLMGVALFAGTLPAWADPADGPAGAGAAKAATKLPPEEQVDLLTGDGVALEATFYASTQGKDSVPVVLLHMYKGSRKDYARLALFLQGEGHAVLVPDLRGHGDSTRVRGTTARLDVKSMSSAAFAPMVGADMEACKKFLMTKNNAGELNIEKLCLVGAEMGSVVAMDYARLDWSWPHLVNVKQGQDVKAVVLISPQWQFRSLQMRPAMNQPVILRQIATMILVGEQDARAMKEAKGLYSMLKRLHPTADAENLDERTLVFEPLSTSLQGTKMLDAPELKIPQWIAWFIKTRVVDREFPWKRRESLQER